VKTEARSEALGILYAADSRSLDEPEVDGFSNRVTTLSNGVWENRETIDLAIEEASTSWRMDRMAVVDRNILRIASYELMFTDLSVAIIISEAVEMAKVYSTSGSGAFINGVLSGVAATSRTSEDDES
jgi:N utilization substance protein B